MTTETPPAALRPARAKARPRKITTLSLKATDYDVLQQLAELESCSIHDVIRRSTQMRLKTHLRLDPARLHPNLRPEDLPEPSYLAFVGLTSGEIQRIELM